MNPLAVRLGPLELPSPILTASGTFGYGTEIPGFVDYTRLGAIVTKTVTSAPRPGNPQPRIWETASGVINSIGLQNPGLDEFLARVLPPLRRLPVKVIVSFSGDSPEEVAAAAGRLAAEGVDGVELNISCPNLKLRRVLVSEDPALTREVVAAARAACGRTPLIVKLSPNARDIAEIGRAAEEAGADALSLINTVKALAVDHAGRRLVFGGLSGPAVKPIGLRAVCETYRRVGVPIVGMGGIASGKDALEYLMVGATAIAAGSCSFVEPRLAGRIHDYLAAWCARTGAGSIAAAVGMLNEKTALC